MNVNDEIEIWEKVEFLFQLQINIKYLYSVFQYIKFANLKI